MRGIDLKKIAEKMNGASGAELKVFCSFAFFPICYMSFLKQFVMVLLISYIY